MEYPVLDVLDPLKSALREHPVVILQAPPGAGKSTVLPLKLLDESWLGGNKIIMLEPRRLAARSVAMRLAEQLNESPGETIGYRIRFESKVGSKTRIEVVTEGILTRTLQQDNTLEGVGLLIFDEFHERSLQADLSLALALQAQSIVREDLKILIMSATLDGERISSVLGNAPIITSQGRQFPITYRYLGVDDTPFPSRVAKAIRKAVKEEEGDVLAFFPGAGEIIRTHQFLDEMNLGVVVHELFGDLPFNRQQEAILPDRQGRRKVVLATSIAETSLTIEGVRVVVDGGLARVPKFDPRSGLTRLETVKVTQDAADQRAGRAGRLAPGVAYRLWPEATHQHLLRHRSPEILDADLATLLLELSLWGVSKVESLQWITTPPIGAIHQARELLHQLDALENGKITPRGKNMVKLPTHPRIAHLLLEAEGWSQKALALACDVAAVLEERDPLVRESGPDLALRIEVLRKWRSGERVNGDVSVLQRIEKLAAAWRSYFRLASSQEPVVDEEVGELVALAYPERIAKQMEKHGERYKLANGRVVKLPNHDALTRNEWLVVAQLDAGNVEGKIFMAAPVNDQDLEHLASEKEIVRWDKEREMVVGVREKRVGGLVLQSKPLGNIPSEHRLEVLFQVIREEGLGMIGWGDTEKNWQARVLSLRQWRPELNLPDVSEEPLLASLEGWLEPFLTNVYRKSELQRIDLQAVLHSILPWELMNQVESLAPAKIEVPSGSFISLIYFADGRDPVMEVRLQEMFGLPETPTVNQGRTKVLLQLLSPGYKPVQVTQDLRSFWENTYHEVKNELKRRYPKHSWPDDPWTAQAVRGARKRSS